MIIEISNLDNLHTAFLKVKKKRKGFGLNENSIQDFENNLELNLKKLSYELKSGIYIPKTAKKVFIPKKNGKKRAISIMCIEDRIIQNAILNILYPIFESNFIENSFGFRKDISYTDAISKLADYIESGYYYILDADISSFFDEINHSILIKILNEKIEDEKLMTILKRYLKQLVNNSGKLEIIEKGILQGSALSPLFANIFLDDFDHFIEENNFIIIRYADDFVILTTSIHKLEEAYILVNLWLNSNNLKLNMEKTRFLNLYKTDELEFLGYSFKNGIIKKI